MRLLCSRNGILWFYMVIVLAGFGLRVPGVTQGLPFIHNGDESNFYMRANDERGLLDAGWRNDWMRGYPPGYIWFYAGTLTALDWISDNNIHTDMSKLVAIMRLVNVLSDLITLALIIRVVAWLAGRPAGLLAGGVYALSAAVLDTTGLALSDPLMVTWCALCMLLTVHAFRHDSRLSALLATAAGLLAVTFKYSVFAVLLLPGAYFAWLLWRKRTRALLSPALALVMVIGVLYGLLFVYGGTSLEINEAKNFRTAFIQNTFTPLRWQYTLNGLFGTIGAGMLLVSAAALWRLSGQKMSRALWLAALIAGTGLAILAIIPGYLAYLESRAYPVRYTLPAAMLVLTGLAVPVGQAWLRPPRRAAWQTAAIVLLPLVTLLPDIATYLARSASPYAFTVAQRWFEQNIPDGSVLWMESGNAYTSLSRYDRGYSGYKNFVALLGQTIPEISEAEKARVQYIYLTEDDLPTWPVTKGWLPLENYPLLKRFSSEQGYIGPDLYVYLAHPLPHPQRTVFSDGQTRLALRSLEVQEQAAQLIVNTYWQADEKRPEKIFCYGMYLLPAGATEGVLAQRDGPLGNRTTETWDDRDELIRGEFAPVDLPDDLAPGTYTLWLAVYNCETVERLLLDDGANWLAIYTLRRSS